MVCYAGGMTCNQTFLSSNPLQAEREGVAKLAAKRCHAQGYYYDIGAQTGFHSSKGCVLVP